MVRTRLTTPHRLFGNAQLTRELERTLRERQNAAAITEQTLADASAITPLDVQAAIRYWERANAGTQVAQILRADDGSGT
jgi:hypothetical protein